MQRYSTIFLKKIPFFLHCLLEVDSQTQRIKVVYWVNEKRIVVIKKFLIMDIIKLYVL